MKTPHDVTHLKTAKMRLASKFERTLLHTNLIIRVAFKWPDQPRAARDLLFDFHT